MKTITMDTLTRFNRQVLQCQDEAYTMAWYLTGNDAGAETAVQEAVIAAYRCYTGQGSTENHSVRRLVLKQVLAQYRAAPGVPVTGNGLIGVDMEEVADLDTRRILQLPEPERQALVLVTILGLNYGEAAAIAGIPVERLRRFLAQALRKVGAREEWAFSGSVDQEPAR